MIMASNIKKHNKWADQNCRGGGADESFFWGECGIRDSHNVFFKEYGICH